MYFRNIQSIKSELKVVDERIHSKSKLMKEYPEDLGLKLSKIEFENRKKGGLGFLGLF